MIPSLIPENQNPANDFFISVKQPVHIPTSDESLEAHAARMILLIKHAGGNLARIVGRTKIAKMDFFLRYPSYLYKALGISASEELLLPESPMIRFRYGPWDNKYYDVFALLLAKGLVTITPSSKGDEFQLTAKGQIAARDLNIPDYKIIIERCQLIYEKFKKMSGTQIKDYIYKNFPEIVNLKMGAEIE